MTSKNVPVAVIAVVLGVAGPIAVLVVASQARQVALAVAFAFICLAVAGVVVAAALCTEPEEPDYDEAPLAEVEERRGSVCVRFEREPRPQLRLHVH